ncbi:hypothetical protein [Streptomyces sp. IBSBF 3136]|uniref:hypothetical protein n=1 Tax=Streptomyces sp. IBSBF 3136 TaxID=2903524 RepID=UPI002FDC2ED0
MQNPVILQEGPGTSSRLHPLQSPKFRALLDYARPGDTVHISEMFRLVRGTGHILNVFDILHHDRLAAAFKTSRGEKLRCRRSGGEIRGARHSPLRVRRGRPRMCSIAWRSPTSSRNRAGTVCHAAHSARTASGAPEDKEQAQAGNKSPWARSAWPDRDPFQ